MCVCVCVCVCVCGATVHRGSRPPRYRDYTITLRHTRLDMTPLEE